MRLSYNQNLLSDTKIMIADNASTCDSKAWHKRMINMKSKGAEDEITAVKREETRPTKISDLPVNDYGENGQEVKRLVLQSVTVAPHGSCKLFNATKIMKGTWELYGCSTKLGTRKGKKKLEFNIVINTSKWAFLCSYLRRNT